MPSARLYTLATTATTKVARLHCTCTVYTVLPVGTSIITQAISSLVLPPWDIHEECMVRGSGRTSSLPHGNIDMEVGRVAKVCCS